MPEESQSSDDETEISDNNGSEGEQENEKDVDEEIHEENYSGNEEGVRVGVRNKEGEIEYVSISKVDGREIIRGPEGLERAVEDIVATHDTEDAVAEREYRLCNSLWLEAESDEAAKEEINASYNNIQKEVARQMKIADIKKPGLSERNSIFADNLGYIIQNAFDISIGKRIVDRSNKQTLERIADIDNPKKVVIYLHGMWQNGGAFREAIKASHEKGYEAISISYDYNKYLLTKVNSI